MNLERPKFPKRKDFYSDKQYYDAILDYKRQRRRWINQNKERDPLAEDSIKVKKGKRVYKEMKDSEFKRKQREKYKQTRLD